MRATCLIKGFVEKDKILIEMITNQYAVGQCVKLKTGASQKMRIVSNVPGVPTPNGYLQTDKYVCAWKDQEGSHNQEYSADELEALIMDLSKFSLTFFFKSVKHSVDVQSLSLTKPTFKVFLDEGLSTLINCESIQIEYPNTTPFLTALSSAVTPTYSKKEARPDDKLIELLNMKIVQYAKTDPCSLK